ncbi:branched-chain amino acid ABC transporter permease [Mesorhizobium sediminum]|nr:branched-chain amino acid ABC transporter permease [Mesorhizobium sediminum]
MFLRQPLPLLSVVTASWMMPVAIACIVAVVGLSLNSYLLFLLARIVIFVMLIIGLNVLMGYSGQLSFAHAALFGVGAYATGLLQVHLGVPFVVAIIAATVMVTALGTLLALPALRLSGIHLAVATLAIAQAVHWVLINWTPVTFGAGGFRAPTIRLFGLDKTETVFLVSLSLTTISYLLVRQLTHTSFGRRFVAVRDNPIAAAPTA